MTPESKLEPRKNQSRLCVLEDHLSSHETTLAVLLQQAFRITEEMASGLQSSKGFVQVEALSRKLLESHMLTITHIVKQLSVDIQALQRQLTQRDSVTSGFTLALQSLDQKNMAGIGDLRGRVARCDASIAKLSTDMSSGEPRMIGLQKEVAELRSAVYVKVKELEAKLRHDLGRLQASLTEHQQSQTSSMSDLQKRVKLEDMVSCGLKDVKEQIDSLRKWTEQQLNSSIQTHARSSQQIRSLLQHKMFEAETGLAERLHALEARMEHFQANQLKCSETKLSKRMTSVENSLQQELQLLKQEYHKGFLSVHDAIDSLKQIGDIKARLDKEMLQKDIRHIGSKVAELTDS